MQYTGVDNVVETAAEGDTVTAPDVNGGGGGGGGGGGAGVGPFRSAKESTGPSHCSTDFGSSLFVALVADLCRLASPYNKQ